MRLYLASVSYHLLVFVCECFVSPLHIAKHVYLALICLLYIRGIENGIYGYHNILIVYAACDCERIYVYLRMREGT